MIPVGVNSLGPREHGPRWPASCGPELGGGEELFGQPRGAGGRENRGREPVDASLVGMFFWAYSVSCFWLKIGPGVGSVRFSASGVLLQDTKPKQCTNCGKEGQRLSTGLIWC